MFAQAFSLLCIFTFSVTASPYHSQSILTTNGECPAGVHIIGVRGTTEQPGFGKMKVIVKQLLGQLNGSDAYSIVYPAKGITLDPPDVSFPEYKKSEADGVTNLTAEIIRFTDQCPNNGIVLMGYSQGAHVVGDVLCGRVGGGIWSFPPLPPIDQHYKDQIKAIVQFGDPSNRGDLPWHMGTSTTWGWFRRQSITDCTALGNAWQSYCDIGDPFCAGGLDVSVHLNYTEKYYTQVIDFIVKKVGTSQHRNSVPEFGELKA